MESTSRERLRDHDPLAPSAYPNVYHGDYPLNLAPSAFGSNGQSNYFIQQCPPPNTAHNGFSTDNQLGSLAIDNGCININVPCAYTYPYHSKSTNPKKQKTKVKRKTEKKEGCHCHQSHRKGSDVEKPITIRLQCSQPQSSNNKSAPFCSTVRSDLCGPPSKGYIAKSLPSSGGPPKSQNKTKMKWDFEADCKIPVRGVDYGEELYEQAARNYAMQSHCNQSQVKGPTTASSSTKRDGRCPDFSTPAFNSSLKKSNELASALEGLKNLPIEIERIFKTDRRFEPIILDKASKALNVRSKTKVFKDLVPVEPNDEIVRQLSRAMLEEVESVRPLPRSRDPEPSILDYQEPSFSRMKPKAVLPPTKPTSGVSVELTHSYHVVESENKFQEHSNKM